MRISLGNMLSGVGFASVVAFALAVGALGSGGDVTPVRAGVATCPPWTPNPDSGRYPVEQRRDVEVWYGTVTLAGDDVTNVQLTDHITPTLQSAFVNQRAGEPRLEGSADWVVQGDNRTWILATPEGLDAEQELRDALEDAGGSGTQFDAPVNQGTDKYVIANWLSTCDSANGFVDNEGAAYVTFYELNASAPGAASDTPTPVPTATPGRQSEDWGDNDCDDDIDADDALRGIIAVAAPDQLDYVPDCPEMGETVTIVDIHVASAGAVKWGDSNCDGFVTVLDALGVLRFIEDLPPFEGGCSGGFWGVGDELTFE